MNQDQVRTIIRGIALLTTQGFVIITLLAAIAVILL